MIEELLERDRDRGQFMDWDFAKVGRQSFAFLFAFLLITSGFIPFADLDVSGPVDTVSAQSGEYIYTGGDDGDGTIKKLTADGETVVWETGGYTQYGVGDIKVQNGYVYMAADTSAVKLDASDGSEIWSHGIGGIGMAIDVDSSGDVFVSSEKSSDGILKLDGSDGSEIWESTVPEYYVHAIGVDSNGDAYAGTKSSQMTYKIDGDTGEKIWEHAGRTDGAGDNVKGIEPHEEYVYISDQNGHLTKVDASDGSEVWYHYDGGGYLNLEVGPDGYIYVGNWDGELHKYDPSNGEIVATYTGHGEKINDVAIGAGGSVYSGDDNDEVHKSDQSQNQLWTYTGHEDPVMSVAVDETGSQSVSGTVSDSSGNQIDSASVEITDDSDGSTVFSGTTDASGAWSTELEDGSYTLDVSKTEYHPTSKSFSVSGSSVTVDATIETQEIRGSIEDADGNLLDDAQVVIRDQSDGTIVSDSVESATYETQVPDGSYWVNVSKDSYLTNETEVTLSSGGTTDAYNDVVLHEKPTVGGVVTDQNGDPCSNCTVEVVGVDTSTLNLSAGEDKQQKADELLAESNNPLPDSYDPELSITGDDGLAAESNAKYVAVHQPEDWATPNWVDTIDLSNPSVPNPPANEPITLSVWNPSMHGGGALPGDWDTNTVDKDLPGATVKHPVVVERVDPVNDAIDSKTYNATHHVTTGIGPGEKEHHFVQVSLPAGVYRIHPEGVETTAYTIVVGDKDSLRKTFATDLETKAGDLSKAAQELEEKYSSGTYKRKTATTNADGEYEVVLEPGVERVAVSAYKINGDVLPEKNDPTPQDLRSWVMSNDYNGSVYFALEPTRYSPPNSQADVQVRKFSSPPYTLLDDWASKWGLFRDRMENDTLTELGAVYDVPLDEWDQTQLEDGASNLSDVMTDEMIDQWEEQRNQDWETFQNELENQERRNDELREDIRTMESTIESLRDELANVETEVTVEINETTGAPDEAVFRNIYDGDFEKSDVTATWHDFDGSVEPIPDEHITVNKRAGRGDEVVVEYPLPEGSSGGTISALVVDEDNRIGSGRSDPITIGNDAPELRSIDVSTIEPGPGETVSFDANFETAGVTIESIDVWHDGEQLNATKTGGLSGKFTPTGAGEHVVRITFNTTDDSGPYVESFRVDAADTTQDSIPRVYVRDGNLGVFAIAADGVDDAEATIEKSGGTLDVTAMVGPDSGVNEVKYHLEDAPAPPEQTITLRVVEGKQLATATSMSRHVGVIAAGRSLSSDAILTREGSGTDASNRPITRDGETRGGEIRSDEQGGDVVHSYTSKNGEVTLDVNNDPGRWDRFAFWWSVRTDDWSLLAAIPTLPGFTAVVEAPVDTIAAVDVVGVVDVVADHVVAIFVDATGVDQGVELVEPEHAIDSGASMTAAYPQTELIA